MYDIYVDDVYVVYFFEGFRDSLNSSKMWKFYKRVDFVENLNCRGEVGVVN